MSNKTAQAGRGEEEVPRAALLFANAVLAAGLGAAASVIALLLRRGDASGFAYGVPLVGAGAFAWALTRSAPLRLRAALLAVSVALPVYGAEIFLTIRVDEGPSRLEAFFARREQRSDIWPALHPHLFVESDGLRDGGPALYPLSGISDVESVYCPKHGSDAWEEFVGDEHGFRNPRGLHRPGAVDVLLVGDSFTQGNCVASEENVAGRLRSAGVDALSLGMDGSGPLIELAVLTEYGLPLRPRRVFWLYYEGNDLLDLKAERDSRALRRYLDAPGFRQDLRNRRAELDERLKAWVPARRDDAERRRRHPLLTVFKLEQLRARFGLVAGRPAPDPLFRSILREARRRSEAAGATFGFVYLPELSRYHFGHGDDGSYADRDAVLRIVREEGIETLDFGEVLGAHAEPLTLFGGAHYNARGYGLLAEAILASTREP